MSPNLRRRLERRIRSAWGQTRAFERGYGSVWYRLENRWCRDVARSTGFPLSMVAGVYAALSPNNNWMSNRVGVKCMTAGMWTGFSAFGRDRDKAIEILAGADPESQLRGRKTSNFYRLLRDGGNDYDVCIDGHIVNLVKNKRRRLQQAGISTADYDQTAAVIRKIAYKLGVRPCDLQATLWLAWRNSGGFVQGRIAI